MAHPQRVLNFLHELGKGTTSSQNSNTAGVLENKYEGRTETEILRLREVIKKLKDEKDAGLAKFYELLKKVSYLESRVISAEEEESRALKNEASKYGGGKISCLQKKLLEAEDQVWKAGKRAREAEDEIERLKKEVGKLEGEREQEISTEKLNDKRLSLEIEKSVMTDFVEGLAHDADQILRKKVMLEKEREFLISRVKELHELSEGLKCELGRTLDDNEGLVLENSVLLWLFGELKMQAAEVEEERKLLQETLNDASRKVLELETDAEILKQKEDEKNEHEEKLKLDMEAKNVEFSVLQESYQNLHSQIAKVGQDNMVLRKDFLELKQQNLALSEGMVHQNELQFNEAKQNLVATPNKKLHRENLIEILNYGKKVLSLDEKQFSEAVDVELMKETAKVERIVTVEKIVNPMFRFSTPDDTEINCNVAQTLAEESRYQCYSSLDDMSVRTSQYPTQHKSHIGLKMSAPLWGLKIGKSASKASSVSSDASKDSTPDQYSQLEHHGKVSKGGEKKHKGRMSDLGKKLHLKNYLPTMKKKEKIPA